MLCPQECFVHEEGANSGVLFLLVFCYVNQPSMFFCASLHMVLAFSYSLAGNRNLLWTDVALKCGELALSSECDLSRVVFLTSFLCSHMWCQIAFSLTCVDQIVGSSVSFLTCTLLVTIARIRVSLGRRLWANSCSPLWGVPPSYLCSICVDSPVTEGSGEALPWSLRRVVIIWLILFKWVETTNQEFFGSWDFGTDSTDSLTEKKIRHILAI